MGEKNKISKKELLLAPGLIVFFYYLGFEGRPISAIFYGGGLILLAVIIKSFIKK